MEKVLTEKGLVSVGVANSLMWLLFPSVNIFAQIKCWMFPTFSKLSYTAVKDLHKAYQVDTLYAPRCISTNKPAWTDVQNKTFFRSKPTEGHSV